MTNTLRVVDSGKEYATAKEKEPEFGDGDDDGEGVRIVCGDDTCTSFPLFTLRTDGTATCAGCGALYLISDLMGGE